VHIDRYPESVMSNPWPATLPGAACEWILPMKN